MRESLPIRVIVIRRFLAAISASGDAGEHAPSAHVGRRQVPAGPGAIDAGHVEAPRCARQQERQLLHPCQPGLGFVASAPIRWSSDEGEGVIPDPLLGGLHDPQCQIEPLHQQRALGLAAIDRGGVPGDRQDEPGGFSLDAGAGSV